MFIEAVLYRYRVGIPWRDLPECFGDFRVVHTRFSRWSNLCLGWCGCATGILIAILIGYGYATQAIGWDCYSCRYATG
ncbi:putative transposase [Gloeomargarita lithophora Alchichica-D10]|uniref:Putative transposase n=1 Tax=Gloeomargarita lithophora Alchichica-D10 TaxID=1188229 RepID=A0A1J0AFV1_9CYAN|nr:putative transposase [Gloeomargarita lithophora Alchichica-D10]